MFFPRSTENYKEDFQLFPEYLDVMVWINIHVCLPFTFVVIALCFTVRLDHIPATYYVNLLVSNLIQIIILIIQVPEMSFHPEYLARSFVSYSVGGMASFSFRMIFALERFIFVSWPQCQYMRQCKGFVTITVFAWIFTGVLLFLILVLYDVLPQICFLFLVAFVSTILLAVTLKSLCTAASMPIKEKYRNTGILVLLLVQHIVIMFPTGVYFIYLYFYSFEIRRLITEIILTLNLHSPLIDLFLFVFMSKGPFIKLPMFLCCCRKETPAVNDSSSSSV